MSYARAAAVIAGVLLVIGLGVGFIPTQIVNGAREVPCGSGFAPDTAEAERVTASIGLTDYATECEDTTNTRRWIALPLAVVGATGLMFVALTRRPTAGASTDA